MKTRCRVSLVLGFAAMACAPTPTHEPGDGETEGGGSEAGETAVPVDDDAESESGTGGEPEPDDASPSADASGDGGSTGDDGCEGECCDGECEHACDSDADCELGAVCAVGVVSRTCLAAPVIGDCVDTRLVRIADIEGTPVTSLRFVDVDRDGRAELAVGHASGLDILASDQSKPMPVMESGAAVRDVAAGDFDGDGGGDLIVAQVGGLTLLGDAGSDGPATARTLTLPVSPVKVEALQWDGGGAHEAVVLGQTGRVELYFDFSEPALPLAVANGIDMAVADLDGDALDDVVVQSVGLTPVFFGNADGNVHGDGVFGSDHFDANGIVAGRFADPSSMAIARHREVVGQWTLVDGGGGAVPFRPQALFTTGLVSDAGDLDGDGFDDLVLLDSWRVTAALGGAPHPAMFGCATSHGLETPASMVAVGDRDGDGMAEIAVSHGLGVALFAIR